MRTVYIKPKQFHDDGIIAILGKKFAYSLWLAFILLGVLIYYSYQPTTMTSVKELISIYVVPLIIGVFSSAIVTVIFSKRAIKESNKKLWALRQEVLYKLFWDITWYFIYIARSVSNSKYKLELTSSERMRIAGKSKNLKEWFAIFEDIFSSYASDIDKYVDNHEFYDKEILGLGRGLQKILTQIRKIKRQCFFLRTELALTRQESNAILHMENQILEVKRKLENTDISKIYDVYTFALFLIAITKTIIDDIEVFDDFKEIMTFEFTPEEDEGMLIEFEELK